MSTTDDVTHGAPVELPVVGVPPVERADAARNRERILAAAERLFASHGVEGVSMEAIAAEACVGKGTVFRRFGDRAGLAQALLDEHDRRFQEGFIRGPAPLGPGAPAVERLVAFGWGRFDLLERHGELLLASETGAPLARWRTRVYAMYRTHMTALVREADPRLDAEYLADTLLGVLGAELFLYLRRVRQMDVERIRDGWEQLVRRLLGPG